MARPKGPRLVSRKPSELILLRRFAALPNEHDRFEFMAACMNVVGGESVDSAYQIVCARRRKAAAKAKTEARRVAQLAQRREGAGDHRGAMPSAVTARLKEDLRALLADVILSEPLVLDPEGNVVPLFRPGGPPPRPVRDDTGDAA